MIAHSLHRRFRAIAGAVTLALLVAACASSGPPRHQDDVCAIFASRPAWRDAVLASEARWGAPAHVQMAIMWKESSFRHDARPPRRYVMFGLVPWGRVSSAYGYSQALDGTWERYLSETGRSSWMASRDDFADAADFVGWYMATTRRVNGVSMDEAVAQYLNYHEGHGGYRRGSYRQKQWLINAAGRVGARADRYRQQMSNCR